jgi:putative protease
MESLQAAINSGADACYLGLGDSNMRKSAKNFTDQKFLEAFQLMHDRDIKGYMTLNSVYYGHELDMVKRQLDVAVEANVDSVICWDPMIMAEVKRRQLPLHISTQASISNSAAAQFYKDLGAECIVLARECTLKDMVEIKKNVDIDIEVFIHGAMCMAVSGRCFISQFTTGHSANRGDCKQPCRYDYELTNDTKDINIKLQNSNFMSPKDLCTMPLLDKLLLAGADTLKIEGRARNAEYVAVTVAAYRKAIDAFYENKLTSELKTTLNNDLKTVFNREFSNGFYMGQRISDWSRPGNFATEKKEQVGRVLRVYPKINVIEVSLQASGIKLGDKLLISGERCGAYFFKLESMQANHKSLQTAEKGINVGIKIEDTTLIRANDEVYILKSIFGAVNSPKEL